MPLLSIHLSSNRPDRFVDFLDRLERSTADLSAVEVVVKIDSDDAPMNRLLEKETKARPFRVKYLSTPLEGGFFGLWRCYDELLRACDPQAYFVMGLNDEMGFKTERWDRVLATYVGLFPDHIFRLRTSSQRNRNYYDFWEAGFANDTSAIMTKRWLDLGGGWCPCNGPDSFQQCVAFYFGWLDRFNANRPYREFAIYDIELSGHGANVGLSGAALRRRQGASIAPWFTLMSHRMQEEAARRAQKLHAHIWAAQQGLDDDRVLDNRRKQCVEIVDRQSRLVLHRFPYGLSAIRITLANGWRGLNYLYYGGGGEPLARTWRSNVCTHLRWRYPAFDALAEEYYEAYGPRPQGRSRAYYIRRVVFRLMHVRPYRVHARVRRLREVFAYQVQLLRRIHRDPAAADAIPRPWKRRLYRGLAQTARRLF